LRTVTRVTGRPPLMRPISIRSSSRLRPIRDPCRTMASLMSACSRCGITKLLT
jgi:hypothetical protein